MTVPIVSATLVWALIAYFFFPGGVLPILSVGSLLAIACLLTSVSVSRPLKEYEEMQARSRATERPGISLTVGA